MAEFPKLPRVRADDENMEKIHCAARKGQTEEVRRFVEQGVDPAIPNKFGCTAFHLACKYGQVDTAKYLCTLCDVNNSWHGQKPLHLAVLSKKEDLVEALVSVSKERGRNVEIMLNELDEVHVNDAHGLKVFSDGQTALHWCVALGEDFLPMLKLLLRLGSSPTAKNKENVTPFMYAIMLNNTAAMDCMLEDIKPNQLRLDYQDKEGRSHLHYAIMHNREDYAMKFIELGHSLEIEDDHHEPPLSFALRAAMCKLLEYLLERVDAFSVQQAPFHNGSVVLPERIQWFSFATDEQEQAECIRIFQKRLAELCAPQETAVKKKPTIKKMKLAPSAPVRSRSVGKRKSLK
ncbi:putative Ankyrin repeats (many copies) [Trypanosoma vivax]|uniref:Uncharacterized protein n=1 Tax=Trypanosoma vivax (strain Y486) TaxID=1055687 RepID=G0TTI9_TRYVY|nr:putative Ankyrin repeats (many copies) [Trypanosoma vivax]CCC47270.1 conserved hypothetical protein [Trypanosoma vivax Y486]